MKIIPAKSTIKFNYQIVIKGGIFADTTLGCSAELYKTQEE